MSQQPLQYETRVARRGRSRYGPTFVGAALGLFLTVPAVFLGIASAGGGHGDYALARAVFPVPMLLTLATHDTISVLSIVLALAQFSIYGAVIGWCSVASRKALLVAIAAVLLLHLLAATACFAGAVPNFS
jgi:hypothetical protein